MINFEVGITAAGSPPSQSPAQLVGPYQEGLKKAGLKPCVLPYHNFTEAEQYIYDTSGLIIFADRDHTPESELFFGKKELEFVDMATRHRKKIFVPRHKELRGAEIVNGSMVGERILEAAFESIITFRDLKSIRRSLKS